jgi:hypothetical protein
MQPVFVGLDVHAIFPNRRYLLGERHPSAQPLSSLASRQFYYGLQRI